MDQGMPPEPASASKTGELFQVIDQQAEKERAALIAEAKAQARVILDAAAREIDAQRQAAERKLEQELHVEEERLLGEARMDARNEQLSLKRGLIAEAFALAKEEILRLTETGAYSAVMKRLRSQAIAEAGEGCSVESAGAEARGSLVVTSADGRKRLDNSLLSRLAKAVSLEEPAVAAILFGGAQGCADGQAGTEGGGADGAGGAGSRGGGADGGPHGRQRRETLREST